MPAAFGTMVDSSFIPQLPKQWLPGAPQKKLPSFRKLKTTTSDSDAMAVDISEIPIKFHDNLNNNKLEDTDNKISPVATENPGRLEYLQEPNLVSQEPDRILESAPYRIQGGDGGESFTITSRRGSPSKSKTKPKKQADKVKDSSDGPKPRQKVAKEIKETDMPIPGPGRWRVVNPETHKDTSHRCPSVHTPRIWASSRSELLAVLPELSRSVNGICESSAEMPILILEGEAWPEDKWDGGTLLEISMVRDFSGFESDFYIKPPSPEHKLHSGPLPAASQNNSAPPPVQSAPNHLVSTNNPLSDFSFFTESGMINTTVAFAWHGALDETTWDKWGVEEQATTHGPSVDYPDSPTKNELHQVPVTLEQTPHHGIPTACPEHENKSQSLRRSQLNIPPDETRHMFHPYPQSTTVFGLPPTGSPAASYERHNSFPPRYSHLAIGSQEKKLRASSPLNSSSSYSGWVESTSAHQRSDIPITPPECTHYSYEAHLSEQPHIWTPNFSTIVHSSTPASEPWNLRVPQPIPPEIQILVDGCRDEIPVLVIMAQGSSLMPFTLSPEYAYLYLGFFRVIEHSHSFLIPPSHLDVNGLVNSRVQWHFKFRWEAGGEQFLPDPTRALTPWWSPDHRVMADETKFLVSSNSKKVDFNQRYYSFLPPHLFAIFGPSCSDEAFPRGWHCSNCGKLNEQILLRHQNCSYCKPNGDVGKGFAVRSHSVRDPHQMLPMSIPCNHYPDGLEYSAVTWADSMRTFNYEINKSAIAKHIFTCNIKRLQGEPSYLFEVIQLYVPLSRQTAGTTMTPGPYFTYLAPQAGADTGASKWEDEPSCVTQAREFLLHRGRWYGEINNLAINNLTIMAWITTGRKRQLITARDSTVAILCLGADILLSIIPKSGFTVKDEHRVSGLIESMDLDATLPCGGSDMDIIDDDLDLEMAQTAATSHPKRSKAGRRTKVEGQAAKKSPDALSVTLVHGDILILAGDDFECSVKRTGTSIFLIASE